MCSGIDLDRDIGELFGIERDVAVCSLSGERV